MHHQKERKVKLKLIGKIGEGGGAQLGDGECRCSSPNNGTAGGGRIYVAAWMTVLYQLCFLFGLTCIVKKSKQRTFLRQDFGGGCEVHRARC